MGGVGRLREKQLSSGTARKKSKVDNLCVPTHRFMEIYEMYNRNDFVPSDYSELSMEYAPFEPHIG